MAVSHSASSLFVSVVCFIPVIGQYPLSRVITIPTTTIYKGTNATLSCRYDGVPSAVYWKKVSTSQTPRSLIHMDLYYTRGKKGGPGYDDGMFDITDDSSLIIKDVGVNDEGTYICQFSDYESGQLHSNSTDATVLALATDPVISQCTDKLPFQIDSSVCLHDASSNITSNVTLDCTVSGFYPNISVSWTRFATVLSPTNSRQSIMADGTLQRTVSICVGPLHTSHQVFTCVAEGTAVAGGISKTSVVVTQSKCQAEYRDEEGVANAESCSGWKTGSVFLIVMVLALFMMVSTVDH